MILNYISDPFVPVNSAWEARGVLSSLIHSSHRSNAHQEGFNEVVFISSFKMLLLCRSTGISRDMSKYIMVSCPVHTRSKHRLLSNNVVSASSHLGISSIMNKPSVPLMQRPFWQLAEGRRLNLITVDSSLHSCRICNCEQQPTHYCRSVWNMAINNDNMNNIQLNHVSRFCFFLCISTSAVCL